MKNLIATVAIVWSSLSKTTRFWLVVSTLVVLATVSASLVDSCQRWQDRRIEQAAQSAIGTERKAEVAARIQKDTATAQYQQAQTHAQTSRKRYESARRRIDSLQRLERQRAGH